MAQKMAHEDEELSEVNVIPLADLSLVLLIILMVLSPMISQALISISAAKAQQAASQQELATPETPVIVSYAPGKLEINGVVMGTEMEFVKRLSTIMYTRKDKTVMLTASPLMTHGKVVHVMDSIRRHGGDTLVMLKWDTANPS